MRLLLSQMRQDYRSSIAVRMIGLHFTSQATPRRRAYFLGKLLLLAILKTAHDGRKHTKLSRPADAIGKLQAALDAASAYHLLFRHTRRPRQGRWRRHASIGIFAAAGQKTTHHAAATCRLRHAAMAPPMTTRYDADFTLFLLSAARAASLCRQSPRRSPAVSYIHADKSFREW